MTNSTKPGDKAAPDASTKDPGKVRLGDWSPAFVRAGDKVVRDASSKDEGRVRLGDWSPAFTR
jgi:hypothetical protein